MVKQRNEVVIEEARHQRRPRDAPGSGHETCLPAPELQSIRGGEGISDATITHQHEQALAILWQVVQPEQPLKLPSTPSGRQVVERRVRERANPSGPIDRPCPRQQRIKRGLAVWLTRRMAPSQVKNAQLESQSRSRPVPRIPTVKSRRGESPRCACWRDRSSLVSARTGATQRHQESGPSPGFQVRVEVEVVDPKSCGGS